MLTRHVDRCNIEILTSNTVYRPTHERGYMQKIILDEMREYANQYNVFDLVDGIYLFDSKKKYQVFTGSVLQRYANSIGLDYDRFEDIDNIQGSQVIEAIYNFDFYQLIERASENA